jgi:oligoribonuclease NrnB/cAMP/cGMP phosphodiesterase (DHH superfamily)
MTKQILGIYHKNCIDGTSAAAVVLKKFPEAKLFPLSHSYTKEDLDPIRDLAKKGAEIYIVDCTLGFKELLEDGHDVVIIDHHISDREEMMDKADGNPKIKYVFDNEKSGASLAWSYFFPEKAEPESIKYVEDSDLGIWQYGDDTKQVNNYLSMFRNNPETMLKLLEGDIEELKTKGALIIRYSDKQIEDLIKTPPVTLKIGEYVVPAYNITMYRTACGNIISEKQDSVAVMFTIKGNNVNFSFRSKEHQNPSALELAQVFGGGGHRNSAGATASLEDFQLGLK